MKFSVIGAGAWGTTLANILAENGNKVILWAREPEIEQSVNNHHRNCIFLREKVLHSDLFATTSIKDAVNSSEILVFAVPSAHLRNVATDCLKHVNSSLKGVMNAAKGLEPVSGKRLSEILCEIMNVRESSSEDRIAVLSGPNLAPEIASEKIASTVIASPCSDLSRILQESFSSPRFRVYRHSDRTGVELGGTLKNVFAIGAGILEGLELGDNARAAYLTRSLHEMTRLGVCLGGKNTTFYGLSGLGDLMATAMSPISRNHRIGRAIAEGRLSQFQSDFALQAVEGVETARMALEWGKKLTIQLPITEEICRVLFENKPPVEAARDLMTRSLKDEGE
ncbi:MAG: NAD(P)-dependent glycerol-3-phosphate dehydrogenase [Candidatus Riflebacteria bacterium]|nr:NAD(P)-dependent glycerol-3-phosphate dehydrogenase [Candidatus Riflebacteria bacterium]